MVELMTDETVLALLESFVESNTEAAHVVTLTDEELAVLEVRDSRIPIPLPWLASQDREQWSVLCTAALRSLVAAGIARAPHAPTSADSTDLELRADVHGVLTIRRKCLRWLRAEMLRGSNRDGSSRSIFRIDSHIVLEEAISPQGIHAFSITRIDEAIARLMRGLGLDSSVTFGDTSLPPSLDEKEILSGQADRLNDANAIMIVTSGNLEGETPGERAGMYIFDNEICLVRTAVDTSGDRLAMESVDPARVGQHLRLLLSPPAISEVSGVHEEI